MPHQINRDAHLHHCFQAINSESHTVSLFFSLLSSYSFAKKAAFSFTGNSFYYWR